MNAKKDDESSRVNSDEFAVPSFTTLPSSQLAVSLEDLWGPLDSNSLLLQQTFESNNNNAPMFIQDVFTTSQSSSSTLPLAALDYPPLVFPTFPNSHTPSPSHVAAPAFTDSQTGSAFS